MHEFSILPNTVPKIHTVIFDLDGTLSDSAVLTIAALENVAPRYGFPVPTEEAVQKATGHANPEFYYILFPGYPRDKVLDMGRSVEHEELRLLPAISGKLLFDGCLELLTRLKEGGIRLNIASTGDSEHVNSILNATGIMGFFDVVSCGCPDKTEMLCEMIDNGVPKRDKSGYIMVGDMKKDSDSARANGILSVGACYGYCKRALSNFDMYIDSPMELLGIGYL